MNRTRRQRIIFLSIFFLIVFFVIIFAQCAEVFSLNDHILVTCEDVEQINKEKRFGAFVRADIGDKTINTGSEKLTISKLIFKLFGFIPIKQIQVDVKNDEHLFIGGMPVGFAIDVDGLLVLESTSVKTEEGDVDVAGLNLQVGDIIQEIEGKKVYNLAQVEEIINGETYSGEEIKISGIRKNEKFNSTLKPAKDVQSGMYKLGLWLKNDATGVGTLTYVNKQTDNFGALGHPITDFDTGVVVPVRDGKIYPCSVIGLTKGERGTPGEMKGVFMQGKNSKGTIEKNSSSGVFGEITDKDFIDLNKSAEIGGRLSVRPGKATLVSSISGVSENYEIEIIKANYQPKSNDKSFVFRVNDERLLNLTGGIIQGMSGSPILQNGKIVGAVTHVFVSDPTKGYGIYIDWMLEN
ncbi:MAG: SpoIVB peptidase [Clostridia bacterium]|nr:SpoIVB peptidase [Clostridia bacterium]